MSEEISHDTKFRPGPNMDLKCGEMSDLQPMPMHRFQQETIEVLKRQKAELAEQIAALTADNARLREALKRTSNNEDCPKCDSGRLRPTASGHWDTCSFAQARDLLSTPPADASGLLAVLSAVGAYHKGRVRAYQENYGGYPEWDEEWPEAVLFKAYEALDPAIIAAAERGGQG